ncbi:MAG TPA: alpha-N-acetylglucosaminidase [Edaphobacter sp.]|nr:alpha-N-acetylglucosaminidase [Edaphobacter sp.]
MWSRRKFIELSCAGAGTAFAAATASAEPTIPTLAGRRAPAKISAETAILSARAVLERQLGSRAASFDLKFLSAADGHEVYEFSAAGGRVAVAGSTGVALCRGVYTYLRQHCDAMITWSGKHLDLPTTFPDVDRHHVVCPYKFVQYFNPCTYGYTMAFWDWSRWERELDWMALHGITMPLALEGQEAIWNRVWLALGLTQPEIDSFSVGPAHLPWHRMGDINNLGGPLPAHFIDEKRLLQHKILDRMRELGMKPVAPAFAGFVPQGFKRLRPDTETFTLLWLPEEFKTIPRSTRTFILHPGQKDLYRQIGKAFIEAYKAEYGEVSYYLADTFNELTVPVREEHRFEDLELFGRTVYESIQAGDPSGTWVMQGWTFVYDSAFWNPESVEALLRGIPNDRMLIIDYANDLAPTVKGKYSPSQWKTQKAFFGKQWINGMAHTFGGNNNLKGNLKLMATEPAAVLASPDHGNLVGWGMCPEGIETNEVVYELMTDAGWQTEAIDLTTWIPAYCRSRYGACPPSMQQAWTLLLESAYSAHIWMTKQAWQGEPSVHPFAAAVDSGPTFIRAVDLFLSCAPQLAGRELYRNDLIELIAQAVGGSVDKSLALAIQAGDAKEDELALLEAARAIEGMRRIDALMNLRPDRRLETWIDATRIYASVPDEAAFYDENARLLITTWGWPELSDYASRVWSGLIRDYYAARWETWFVHRHAGTPFSLDLWQQTWLSSPYRPSPPRAVPDLIAESRALLAEVQRLS